MCQRRFAYPCVALHSIATAKLRGRRKPLRCNEITYEIDGLSWITACFCCRSHSRSQRCAPAPAGGCADVRTRSAALDGANEVISWRTRKPATHCSIKSPTATPRGSSGSGSRVRNGTTRRRISQIAHKSIPDGRTTDAMGTALLAIRCYGYKDVDFYHQERNHQGLDNHLIVPTTASAIDGALSRHARLGGTLNFYYRLAA
jgi:hypothetical protein